MTSKIEISKEFYEAAIALSGAEFRLRDWYPVCSDKEEGQVEHLRDLAYRSSEIIRKYHLEHKK